MKIHEERVVNLTHKTLREFVIGDTLYVQRCPSDMTENLFCDFIRLDRGGVIVARVISTDRPHWTHPGELIRCRAKKIYLWGMSSGDKWNRCHWFAGLDAPAGESKQK